MTIALTALPMAAAQACPGQDPCVVASGHYYALPPPGWDGRSALPTTIFLHGYGAMAEGYAEDVGFTGPFADLGVLLVLPEGVDKAWSFGGSPRHARDDLAFMDQVRADLVARFPVDTARLLVTGFSIGGSMAWDLACHRGRDYAAFAPFSGAFWEPLPASCPSGPAHLRHVHGTQDTVVPMVGRPIGSRARQGDVQEGIAVWRAIDGCDRSPRLEDQPGGLRCEVWDRCGSGRELRLCLFEGRHELPKDWVAGMQGWLASLRRPG